MVHKRLLCSKPFTSNVKVLASKYFIKLSEAKLQAVLSKNMYSEHGLDALILPPSGQVCHSLIVESYCTPGSAQAQAASAIISHISFAGILLIVLPLVRAFKSQFLPSFKAVKNS